MSKHYSRSERERLLKEFKRSGLSAAEFSKKVEVSASTLCKWSKKRRVSNGVEFIELGAQRSYYELQRGEVVLKVPSTEKAERISELMRSLC